MTTQRHTLFISDLHLDEAHTETTRLFHYFIEHQAVHADALYILGDLFEVWLGDDHQTEFNQSIQQSLRLLQTLQIPVYVMHGNRDFMIGKRFAANCACELLPDPTVRNLYGQPVLLMHGDSLCTLDKKHLLFRNIIQHPATRGFLRLLPLDIRKKIAQHLRKNSKLHTGSTASYIMDVVPKSVIQAMEQFNIQYLIHGHTHRPNIHQLEIANNPAERLVLGAWEEQGCALKWHEDGSRELIYFKVH